MQQNGEWVHKQIHMHGQLIFDKYAKESQWRKDSFQQIVLEQLDIHMQK